LRVLLLNPPSEETVIRDYYCSKKTKSNYIFQPIDLLMQSGILADKHEVHAIDAVIKRMGVNDCIAEIKKISPDAILGLWGAATGSDDYDFYKNLSEKTNAKIFITGEIFLDTPETWLCEKTFIDGLLLRFVSTGFMDYLDTGNPGPDCMVRDVEKIFGGLDTRPPKEFSLGRPLHELFEDENYHFSFAGEKKFTTVLTDFGCPFKCKFCVMSGLGYRLRPIDEVGEEWKWINERGIQEVFLTDQCFGADRKRSIELCETFFKNGPGIGWTTFTRADLLNDDLLSAMKKAGCHTVIMGVENADADILEIYNKGLSKGEIIEGFRKCAEYGIRTVATFIIGLPEDTNKSIHDTMSLAREIDPDFVSYNVAVPRAGTQLKKISVKEGLAVSGVDHDQAGDTVLMKTRELSPSQVSSLKKKAVRDFYMRPGYLLKRVKSVRSFKELKSQVKEGIYLLTKNI
jgi:uncharacterized radical SAM superfamily protein